MDQYLVIVSVFVVFLELVVLLYDVQLEGERSIQMGVIVWCIGLIVCFLVGYVCVIRVECNFVGIWSIVFVNYQANVFVCDFLDLCLYIVIVV